MADAIRIALWNANGLIHRRNELEIFLHTEKIDIILVSETHFTNKSYFTIPNYKCYSTQHPDDTAHGGVGQFWSKNHFFTMKLRNLKSFLQARSINITCNNRSNIVVSALNCPPRHSISKEQFSSFFDTLGPKFLAGGDHKAKHTNWGSRLITPKRRSLFNSIMFWRFGYYW